MGERDHLHNNNNNNNNNNNLYLYRIKLGQLAQKLLSIKVLLTSKMTSIHTFAG